jgi:hypothetical protein
LIGRASRKLARNIEPEGATAMTAPIALLGLILTSQAPRIEPGHRDNPVYRVLLEDGWTVGSSRVPFPAPSLTDGASADEERAALKAIAGSERGVEELTRDSVSAPFVLKTHDLKRDNGDLIRQLDLWFVVHASLDEIDPDKAAAESTNGQTVEAGNMKFTSRRLTAKELKRVEKDAPAAGGKAREWYVHLSARLLGRIQVEATDRITATNTEHSWVIASRTDPKFDGPGEFGNFWRPIASNSKGEAEKPEPCPGGASYVKISRLVTVPGALVVESHFAFDEPKAWFDGSPILRSKFSVVAQDRIRALRRELAKSRTEGRARSSSGPKGR